MFIYSLRMSLLIFMLSLTMHLITIYRYDGIMVIQLYRKGYYFYFDKYVCKRAVMRKYDVLRNTIQDDSDSNRK